MTRQQITQVARALKRIEAVKAKIAISRDKLRHEFSEPESILADVDEAIDGVDDGIRAIGDGIDALSKNL